MTDTACPPEKKSRPGAQRAIWAQHQERSGMAILRVMTFISLRFGRSFSRAILYGIAGYFMCFAPNARRASRDYLRRVLKHRPRISDTFQHVFAFGSTIHDRIFLVN